MWYKLKMLVAILALTLLSDANFDHAGLNSIAQLSSLHVLAQQ